MRNPGFCLRGLPRHGAGHRFAMYKICGLLLYAEFGLNGFRKIHNISTLIEQQILSFREH